MSIIRINGATKKYDSKTVLNNIFFKLDKSDRIGLVGKNGGGKTTLLKLILNTEELTDGKIEIDRDITIGYFSQFCELDGNETIVQILDHEFAWVHKLEEELADIESQISNCTNDREMQTLINKQMTLFAEMEQHDGWNYKYKIDTVLTKLHFSKAHQHMPVAQLSGGWRNRASLALLLIKMPDVLLLDEPTNFLDTEGVTWLANWINKSQAAAIVVSHDRAFLDSVAKRIVEVENNRLHEYSGGYSDYIRQKKINIKELEREFVHEEELLIMEENSIKDRAELQKFLKNNRDNKTNVARKLADISKKITPLPAETIVTTLYEGVRTPNQIVNVENVSASYGDTQILSNVTFELFGGERLAIVGHNGCGKSTLIKMLTGKLKPSAGKISWGASTKVICFNDALDELDPDDTTGHSVYVFGDAYGAANKKINKFLRLLGFSDRDLTEKIRNLSGGQRARVALAQCLLSGCNTIILDEPTNHLDITSIQGMECALVNFPGTVIFVSHDVFFIDKTSTRLLVYENGSFMNYSGNLTMFSTNSIAASH